MLKSYISMIYYIKHYPILVIFLYLFLLFSLLDILLLKLFLYLFIRRYIFILNFFDHIYIKRYFYYSYRTIKYHLENIHNYLKKYICCLCYVYNTRVYFTKQNYVLSRTNLDSIYLFLDITIRLYIV